MADGTRRRRARPLAVGGAHNDTLLILFLALALVLTASARPPAAAGAVALVAGVGVKITAGLLLPFLVLSRAGERVRLAAVSAGALLALLVLGVVGFGPHALGFLGAIGEQQQLVATHSIPAETARLLSLHGTPGWWRGLFRAGFALALATALWRTTRGADWREAAAWATLALLVATAWLLPWYAIWALPLAAVSGERRLRTAVLLTCAYAVLIHLPLADPVLSPGHGPSSAERAAGKTGVTSKSRPTRDRAQQAIQELYPQGLPSPVELPNWLLCRRVRDKLKERGLLGVSDDTILRAARRRHI